MARRFDVSRTSLSSESKIMKSSIYSDEMNKLKVKQRFLSVFHFVMHYMKQTPDVKRDVRNKVDIQS